jgi:hypothetical protein
MLGPEIAAAEVSDHQDKSDDVRNSDSSKPQLDGQNVEAALRAERRYCAFCPEVHLPLNPIIPSSGSSDNYQQSNIAPTRMVQSTDFRSDCTKLRIVVEPSTKFRASRYLLFAHLKVPAVLQHLQ